jgi:hypothetical protein
MMRALPAYQRPHEIGVNSLTDMLQSGALSQQHPRGLLGNHQQPRRDNRRTERAENI